MKILTYLKAVAKEVIGKPIVIKAAHTFIQAFLAVWILNGMKLDKITLIAGLAAGLSALKTLLVASVKVARS